MNASKLFGNEAIEAFDAAGQPGELRKCWSYSPNGGFGGPAGATEYASSENGHVEYPALTEEAQVGESEFKEVEVLKVSYDPAKRTLTFSTPVPADGKAYRGVVQQYVYSWEQDELADARVVACRGAHYGFAWGSSCEEIAVFDLDKELQTEALEAEISRRNDSEAVAEIGLKEMGDPTDDGTNWAVEDEAKFLHFARQLAVAAEGLYFEAKELEELGAAIVEAYPAQQTQEQWLKAAGVEIDA